MAVARGARRTARSARFHRHSALFSCGLQVFMDKPNMFGDRPVVKTSCGAVVGFSERDVPSVVQFRGVPYATAKRYQNPKKCKPWGGEKDCSMYGPACYQSPHGPFDAADR